MSAIVDIKGRDLPPAPVNTPGEVGMFERLARDPSISVERLQELMALKERADATAARQAFAEAFSDMQGVIPVVGKHGQIVVNREVRSTFARLEDIDRVIKPILKDHGFSITHKVAYGDHIKITSILMHRAGHCEETEFLAPPDSSGAKNGIQAIGSTISYGKRQNIKALLNIAEGGEDNDGNGGPVEMLSEDQQATVTALCQEIGPNMLRTVLKSYKAKGIEEVPAIEYETIVSRLNATKKRGEA